MSNEEKQKRLDYKKNRYKLIIIQTIVLIVLTLIASSLLIVYYQLDKMKFINYSETSEIDYKVYLKENDFYEDSFLGKDQVYVASLIDNIETKFNYQLRMEAYNVEYQYTYKVDAQLKVVDGNTNVAIFDPVYKIVEEKEFDQNSNNNLIINETVNINYDYYNNIANKFLETYDLDNTRSGLVVRLEIKVISNCVDFEDQNENQYIVELYIPLTNKTVNIEMTSSVPTAETKILACQNEANKNVFKVISIVLFSIDGFVLIGFVLFVYMTRNTDINYSIKVKKLVTTYKSYIQEIKNNVDLDGYQILMVNTFLEMLEIRDTIQSPILMNENEDQTCTKFFILTNTKVVYMFEIKVDDYDEIYCEDEEKKIIDNTNN